MATYAIGDIQGCAGELQRLVDRIDFDPDRDRLWFTGDLVNRGPDSLAAIEFIRGLGEAATVVLGNHDLHLLACAFNEDTEPGTKDTFQDVLAARQRDEILHWLRRQALAYHDRDLATTMIHAGVPPQWTIANTLQFAAEVETVLGGNDFREFLRRMYGNKPKRWRAELADWDRLRLITNYLTRLRYCDSEGKIDFKHKGPVGSQSPDLHPWYELYPRLPPGQSIVFGHWSALHLSSADMARLQIYALDTGAVWGGTLTALRLEDKQFFHEPSRIALAITD